MLDHYFQADPKQRPFIIGLTASPIKQKVGNNQQNIQQMLKALANNLNSDYLQIPQSITDSLLVKHESKFEFY